MAFDFIQPATVNGPVTEAVVDDVLTRAVKIQSTSIFAGNLGGTRRGEPTAEISIIVVAAGIIHIFGKAGSIERPVADEAVWG